jgi:hypothetical protein
MPKPSSAVLAACVAPLVVILADEFWRWRTHWRTGGKVTANQHLLIGLENR